MDLTRQILLGTALLSLCSILHVALLSKTIDLIPHLGKRISTMRHTWRMPIFVGITFAMVVFSHTVQVWIWATSFIYSDAITDWPTSVYFSLVTFTSLGYGDITLGSDHRVFAAFGAVTGMLSFGISTAFLVGLVSRILSMSPAFKLGSWNDNRP